MSQISRVVFTNGTDKNCKILGLRNHSIVAQGKHRKIYYNSDQVKTINKRTLDHSEIDSLLEVLI